MKAIETAVAPLVARIAVLEKREALHGRDGLPGVPGPAGRDGEKGAQGAQGERGEIGPAGPAGPAGERGAPGERGETGERGEIGTEGVKGATGERGPQGAPGEPGPQGRPGERGEKGVDGVGLAGAVIDKDGSLVVTLTDGAVKHLGSVVGRDGVNGKDGRDGKDGIAFGLEHLQEKGEFNPETGELALVWRQPDGSEKRVTCMLTTPHDFGIYKRDVAYRGGAGVTWGGSFWIAQRDIPAGVQPGLSTDESRAWRLAVKRGNDGKPGAPGPIGPEGKEGPRGPQGLPGGRY